MRRFIFSIVVLIMARGMVMPLIDDVPSLCVDDCSDWSSDAAEHPGCGDLCLLSVCSHVVLPRGENILTDFDSGLQQRISSASDTFLLSVFLETPSEPPKHV